MNIPFQLTIKHYHTPRIKVSDINSIESWDILRTEDAAFSIPSDRNEWLKAVEGKLKSKNGDVVKDGISGSFIPFSEDFISFVKEKGFKKIVSVGVGVGGLEYQIKKNIPNIYVSCSEYAPKSVEMLKSVFHEADEIKMFDIKDKWEECGEDTLVIMYRVDPHLTDKEWKQLFKTIPAKHILFTPNAFLTPRLLLRELKKRGKGLFSGYVRTKKGYIGLWDKFFKYEELPFTGYTTFYLHK